MYLDNSCIASHLKWFFASNQAHYQRFYHFPQNDKMKLRSKVLGMLIPATALKTTTISLDLITSTKGRRCVCVSVLCFACKCSAQP